MFDGFAILFQLLADEEATEDPTSNKAVHSFWTFEYYQQFFDVESKQVGDRILWSMIPKPGVNYLQTYIRPNPDLYGPFWICVTLIFTTAITGNLANYIQTPDAYKWKYDFHKVTLATTSIFTYAWFVPLLIWGLLLWRGSRASLTLLDLICLYGYSLAVFVPVSLLWVIPLKWLQWCLGIVASVLSGGVLVRTILPALSQESKRTAIAIAAIIIILHASLALGFMLYFFYPPTPSSNVNLASNATLNAEVHNNAARHEETSKLPPVIDVPGKSGAKISDSVDRRDASDGRNETAVESKQIPESHDEKSQISQKHQKPPRRPASDEVKNGTLKKDKSEITTNPNPTAVIQSS